MARHKIFKNRLLMYIPIGMVFILIFILILFTKPYLNSIYTKYNNLLIPYITNVSVIFRIVTFVIFSIILFIILCWAIYEIYSLNSKLNLSYFCNIIYLLLCCFFFIWPIFLNISKNNTIDVKKFFNYGEFLIIGFFLTIIGQILSLNRKTSIKKKIQIIFYKMTVILGFIFFVYLCYFCGLIGIIFTCILVWIVDTSAWLFGSKFGKRKIFKKLSPNKTLEGYVCSFLFTLFIMILTYCLFYFTTGGFLYPFLYKKIWYNFLIIFVLAIILINLVFIGDLFFSKLKRVYKIKNYSKLLKSHGGLLDRIDGLLFSFIGLFIFLLISIIII